MSTIRKRGDKWQSIIRISGHPDLAKSLVSKTDAKRWAMTIKIKDNHKEIVEQKRAKKIAEIQQQDEQQRRKDPRRYGHFNPRGRLVNLRTKWHEIFPREKDEYELALEELGVNSSEKEYY